MDSFVFYKPNGFSKLLSVPSWFACLRGFHDFSSVLSLSLHPRCSKAEKVPVGKRSYWYHAVPIGITTAVDVAMSNLSFLYITVTFYTIVKSSALIFVLIFGLLFNLEKKSWKLFVIISVITAGVILASYGETEFSVIGLILVVGSAASGGLRWALTQVHTK